MPQLRLTLLGQFYIARNGEPLTRFESDKARALLVYLAVEADRLHRRDTLLTLLWPDYAEKVGRQNLSRTLYRLRQTLGDDEHGQPLLLTSRQDIQLNPQAALWLDVAAFRTQLAPDGPLDTPPDHPLSATHHDALQAAATLYRGDFLAESLLADTLAFEAWTLTQREQLRAQAVRVFERLTQHALHMHDSAEATRLARRLSELDSLREASTRLLMQTLAQSGQRSAALQHYETLRRRLAQELGLEPEATTRALYEQIRQGSAAPLSLPASNVQPVPLARRPVLTPPHAPVGAPASAAERRLVTVLCCELAAPQAEALLLDPELWHTVLPAYHQLCAQTMERFMGTTVVTYGRRVLVYFGYPLAREDDARRAVAAGLALLASDTASEGNWEAGNRALAARLPPLAHSLLPPGAVWGLRVALHTGLVVVPTMGDMAARANNIIGQPLEIVSSLLDYTHLNTLVLSADTHRLTGHYFRTASLGTVTLRDSVRPLGLYRVDGLSGVVHRLDVATALHPLVGRETELRTLWRRWRQAEQGKGRTVLVCGDSGIGKSRLVRDMQASLRGTRHAAITLFCAPYQQQSPFYPVLGWLRTWAGLRPHDSAATQRARLGKVVARLYANHPHARTLDASTPDQATVTRLLGALLGLPPDQPAPALSPEQQRQQTLGALLGLLRRQALVVPLLVVVEDTHWADPSTRELLQHVARQAATVPVLALYTSRSRTLALPDSAPADSPPAHVPLERLALAPLRSQEAAQLVARVAGAAPLPPPVVQQVIARADGVPLFLEELTQMVLEQSAGAADGASLVPATLHEALLARLDRLGTARVVVQVAAVLGSEFAYAVLTDISRQLAVQQADSPPADPVDTLQHDLANLEHAGILLREDTPEGVRYSFKHTLIQDVAYETLLQTQRRTLHRAVAEWHEAAYGSASEPERLAPFYGLLVYHFQRAHLPARERHYAALAGAQAAAQFANTEAAQYLSRALALADPADQALAYELLLLREQMYDRQGQRSAQAADLAALAAYATRPNQQAVLALRRAHYALVTSDYPAAVAAARQAITLAQQLSAAASQTQGQAPPVYEAEGFVYWGRALLYQADYSAAQQQFAQALTIAHNQQAPHLEAACLRQLGAVAYYQGDSTAARSFDERALVLFRQLGDRQGEALTLDVLGTDASSQGDYAAAIGFYQEAIALQQRIGDQWALTITLGNLGQLYREQGIYHRASEAFEEGLALCRTIGHRSGEGWFLGNLGWVALDLGAYDEAHMAFAQALEGSRAVGARSDEEWILASLGLLAHVRGNQEQARDYSARVLESARESGERARAGDGWLCRGHALAGMQQWDDAHAAYQEALTIWQELGLSNRALEAQAGLARVALVQGQIDDALALARQLAAALDDAHALVGADEPLRVYLTAYEVLAAAHDAHASVVLATAAELLRTRAAHISDPTLRQSFLAGVAVHRAIWQRAGRTHLA